MSLYTVTSIRLAPIPDLHSGTGTHSNRIWAVVPASVPPPGNLQFVPADVEVTTMLFQLDAAVVPNWFGVAIPKGIQDFTKAHIFFHPMPAQAGYKDSDYLTKTGKWPELFYYMERLGNQLDAAGRNQIIIMPFLTNAAADTGIFPANWIDIVTDILTAVRASLGADDGSVLAISQVAVSSFSVGIVYSHWFRQKALDLSAHLAEVWDFDGFLSSERGLSVALHNTAQYQVIKYDQQFSSDTLSYHVPLPRWANYADPPKSVSEVHGLIRDYMFLHASSQSKIGTAIPGAGTGVTGSTGTTGVSVPPTTGATGTTGMTATTGSTGSIGTTATTHGTGTTGSPGNTGSTGAIPTGPTSGVTASTGVTGSTGTPGSLESTGTTGVTLPPSISPRPPSRPQPQPPPQLAPVTSLPPTPAPTSAIPPSLSQPPTFAGGSNAICSTALVASVTSVNNAAVTAITAIVGNSSAKK